MSDAELVGTTVDAQRAKLEDLISSIKESGANKQEIKQFSAAWVDFAKAVGINDEAVELLFDGFPFAAAEPFFRYVVDTRADSAYESLIVAKPTKENDQGVALKVLINLLVLELPSPTSAGSLRQIAHAIPGLSKNKDGKPFGTLARSVGKTIARPLVRKTINDDAVIDSRDASLILALLRGPVESFAMGAKTVSIEAKAATMFLAWLDGQAGHAEVAEPSNENESNKVAVQAEGCLSDTIGSADDAADAAKMARREARRASSIRSTRIGYIKPSVDAKQDVINGEDSVGSTFALSETDASTPHVQPAYPSMNSDAIDMDAVVAFLITYKKNYESLRKNNALLRETESEGAARALHAEENLKSTQKELESLRNQLSTLKENYAKLQSEVQLLRTAKESLTGELNAAEGMLETLSRRDARQADESNKRLSSHLKVEYRDFLDAVDLPMDVDLGENMREQLKNVFKILKSNGINL